MKMSTEVNEVFTAFTDFQGQVEDVKRDTQSFKGKYATLDQVVQIRKLLSSCGLAFTQIVGDCSHGYVELENVILHKSGQYFSETMKMPIGEMPKNSKGEPSVSTAQHIGMNISYARRYGLLAIAGMAQEDNDAELPEGSKQAQQKKYPTKQELVRSSDLDVKKLAIEQIFSLISKHSIPSEKVDKIKEYYRVSDLNNLSEIQAKSVINKIKSTVCEGVA